jgi:phospholipid/cholesterol/gamma-HCH transport system permease protein
VIKLLAALGKGVTEAAELFGKDLVFLGQVLYWTVLAIVRPKYLKRLVKHTFEQLAKIGVDSLPVVGVTALFTGMVLALQSHIGFNRFGASSLVGSVVALSMCRELGPVLSSIMVAGRCGSSMAAELGTMRVTEQIDALSTMAVNPVRFLVVPRVIASIIAMPILVLLTDIIGIYGGYFVGTVVLGGNPVTYMKMTWLYLELSDVFSGLLKSAVFGLLIAVVSCSSGFRASGGAEGVGTATTRAVVLSSIGILISDYFLGVILF